MEDIDEPSGSVVLQPKGGDMSFYAELTSRNRLLKEQRFEMAENQVKRTRHPFSGYKQLLNYDRTEPKVKMIKRNPTTSTSGLDEEMMGDQATLKGSGFKETVKAEYDRVSALPLSPKPMFEDLKKAAAYKLVPKIEQLLSNELDGTERTSRKDKINEKASEFAQKIMVVTLPPPENIPTLENIPSSVIPIIEQIDKVAYFVARDLNKKLKQAVSTIYRTGPGINGERIEKSKLIGELDRLTGGEMIGGEINTTIKSNQGVIYPYPRLHITSTNTSGKQANLEAYKSHFPARPDPVGEILNLVKRGVF